MPKVTRFRCRSLLLPYRQLLLCALLVLPFASAVSKAAQSAPSAQSGPSAQFDRALASHQRGDFSQAVTLWRELLATRDITPPLSLRVSLGVADACWRMGLYQEGLSALRDAEPFLKSTGDARLAVQYEQQLGNLLLANHQHREALAALNAAAVQAQQAGNPRLHASVLNDLGNALNINGYATDALAAQRQSMTLATNAGMSALAANAGINVSRLQVRQGDLTGARETVMQAAQLLDAKELSFEEALALISLSELAQSLDATGTPQRSDWLQRAGRYAQSSGNDRLRSLTQGYQGADQLARNDLAAAERLTRQALFFAAQTQSNDLLYRWHWQLARILRQQHRLSDATGEFEQALGALAPIRQELMNGYHDGEEFFQRQIKPVYLEFTDTLLAGAEDSSDSTQQRLILERARNTIELMKSAELQDYFRDQCVVAQEAQAQPLTQTARGAAILYPVVLPDRVELVLQINDTLHKQTVRIDQAVLTENVLQLRELIQDPTNTRFLPYANRLYRWLIAPVRAELDRAGVDTLVVVPDGVLRTIPFGVLHDGERYLLQSYALAITPSLTLTAPRPLQSSGSLALLAGVGQSVQGFAPLPNVVTELATIREHIGGKVLVNGDYTTARLTAALAQDDYAIVHMATHSVVGNTPAESFLVTYDGKLTMPDLERLLRIGQFREQPIELLTLSACETALGDERAALGLAGIAMKSGARSAVATLWLVSDDATAKLMSRFYQQLSLRDGQQVSKARALQVAQAGMLTDPLTAHPASWAAFMLIGNWL